jgi:Heparinase II/III N-terminus
MSPSEVAWRSVDLSRQQVWARRQIVPGSAYPAPPPFPRRFDAALPRGAVESVPRAGADDVISAADAILAGRWDILGVPRKDIVEPDWFFDPVTGLRAPQAGYCFRIDHRREDLTGNVKQVWELSRHHHLTVLAAGFALSGDGVYAEAVERQLRSWWADNPFLSGINWTSGIELGLRLVAWVWIRRLLDPWPSAPDLFERNPDAVSQIWWHQRYLAAFRSRGSSANNHVIAEATGQLVTSLAFPWFEQSARWESESAGLLERELAHNTYASGVNRELASDYHAFVAELGLVAALEADRAGRPLADATWRVLGRMLDAGAATLDERLRPPRQNDGDDGRGLMFGRPEGQRWSTLLALGREPFGAPDWWPRCDPDAAGATGQLRRRRPDHPPYPVGLRP